MTRLYFATGSRLPEYYRRHGWRGLRHLARRHPRLLYQMVGGSVVRSLGGWSASHVMVSSGGVVLDYSFGGTRFFPASQVASYPGVAGYCLICGKGSVDMSRFEGRHDAGWSDLCRTTAAYWLLWASRGRIKLLVDCVDVARAALADVGVAVPRHIWTPRQLRDHLDANGHCYLALDSPAGDRRGSDRRTGCDRASGQRRGACRRRRSAAIDLSRRQA